MKKLLFWMALIGSILAILGSCTKDDDDTASTDNTTNTTSTATFTGTTTASGSITVGSVAMSGTYVSGCNTVGVAAAVSEGYFPSDVKANRDVLVVTGNDNVSEEGYFYTDTSCSSLSYYIMDVNDNFTVGDQSGDYYKVTYNETGWKIKAANSNAETFWENFLSTNGITNQGTAINLVVGTEYSMPSNGNLYMNLYSVTSTQVQTGDDDRNTQPTEMDSLEMAKQ